jgi:integrase
MRLTALSVENAKPAAARREIPDALLPGLYLVVQPSGHKSWAVRYRSNGVSKKLTLKGGYPIIDLALARELGREALRKVAKGEDPASDRKADTFGQFAADYLEQHCRVKNRPSTIRLTELYLQNYMLPRWRDRKMADITSKDIRDLLKGVASTKPAASIRLHATLRGLFNRAVEMEVISASPCDRVKAPAQDQSRDRVLSDAELARIWRAAEQMGGPFGAVIWVLTLTAQRKSEVAQMTWDEIDLARGVWALPAARAKNRKGHEIQLSKEVIKILESVPRIADSKYVFTLDGRNAMHASTQLKARLDTLAGVKDWRLHDLRRSAASGMARLGVAPHILDRILNHVTGAVRGIAAIYNRHDYNDERREALARWAKHVSTITR